MKVADPENEVSFSLNFSVSPCTNEFNVRSALTDSSWSIVSQSSKNLRTRRMYRNAYLNSKTAPGRGGDKKSREISKSKHQSLSYNEA